MYKAPQIIKLVNRLLIIILIILMLITIVIIKEENIWIVIMLFIQMNPIKVSSKT
jgi:hypothetical protein